jgi:ribonuclease BN (tRNA processing enzyme)
MDAHANPASSAARSPSRARAQVRVLGCSGSIAARCHTTAFLLDDDVLIDAGTGVGELRLDELACIEHIFLSHSHLDHVLSLPLMADSVIRLRQTREGLRPIHVHALPATLDALRQHIFNGVIWPDFTRLPSAAEPLLKFHPFEIGETLTLRGRGDTERRIEVLPAAHTVPGVGFAIQGRSTRAARRADPDADAAHTAWWIYSGDTGPNPALWETLNGRPIAHLIIETAFGDDEQHLANISGHLAPQTLAAELQRLDGSVSVHITHTKPGEMAAVIAQIRAIDTQHRIEPLRSGQVFEL